MRQGPLHVTARAIFDARLNGRAGEPLAVRAIRPTSVPLNRWTPARPVTTRCFPLEPGAGDGMPQQHLCPNLSRCRSRSILTYDISDTPGGKGEPVKHIGTNFPTAPFHPRRALRLCLPGVRCSLCRIDPVSRTYPRALRLACRARPIPVAERFLKALRIAAANPRDRNGYSLRDCRAAGGKSFDFTYRPAGDIITKRLSHTGRALIQSYLRFAGKGRFRPSHPFEIADRTTNC